MRTAETLDRIGKGPYVNRIIRIGSPELDVARDTYASRMTDIIMRGDPVPMLHFKRRLSDVSVPNIYLDQVAYDTLNPFDIHLSYFQHNCTNKCRGACTKANGGIPNPGPRYKGIPSNMERTVEAIIDSID